MQIINFREYSEPASSVLTIGNFDGVHLGHQALIRSVVEEARAHQARSALLTFNPHPQSVLRAHRVPILTNLTQRLRLFEQLGVDTVCMVPFTQELSQKSAEAFMEQYILGNFDLVRLIIGYDFAFGRNREGTARVLETFSRKHGFSFQVFPAVDLDGEVVSSSRLRKAIELGDFGLARRLLNRPYSVLGPVVKGPQQGRQLGFPTLNLVPEDPLPLTHGVYAARVVLGEETFDGVSNYGIKPTVGASVPTLETYLFEFDREIYGETIEVIPLQHLRDERKFDSLDALKSQIALDCEQAKIFLAGARG
ncbi:MAG: bifunctional riboflavin kinase/FAD synthetase [SAR324 cluster bacterium]|nr:bifunctional riboflavin kinase/FAD synthetase [SAR324 cluster bacterium]MCZ6532300.1 bifunctional riboflavin kinase/FAD synthetase [SAR324 cluster bacterium]MCZ6559155.1 bifunctional riboflavin kinase/FAD synthetase [SAR324 cluster bacterium]MCZ6628636.1 bifunctional riboflavin kinase/FAD synthetase [SAR324 cluster bacterium]